jgi:hypothetical protein
MIEADVLAALMFTDFETGLSLPFRIIKIVERRVIGVTK